MKAGRRAVERAARMAEQWADPMALHLGNHWAVLRAPQRVHLRAVQKVPL